MKKILCALYAAGAVVTFGHAWHHVSQLEDNKQLEVGATMIAAPVCAALWPLYWSEVFWRNHK